MRDIINTDEEFLCIKIRDKPYICDEKTVSTVISKDLSSSMINDTVVYERVNSFIGREDDNMFFRFYTADPVSQGMKEFTCSVANFIIPV